MLPLVWQRYGLSCFPLAIALLMFLPLINSLAIMKTGNLNYESLICGLVTPSKITSGAVKVNVPNLGINIPRPILNYLDK